MRVWASAIVFHVVLLYCGAGCSSQEQAEDPASGGLMADATGAVPAAGAAGWVAADGPAAGEADDSPADSAGQAVSSGAGYDSGAEFAVVYPPRVPDYAGWQRFLANDEYVHGFTVGNDLIVYAIGTQVTALERATGEVRWRARFEPLDSSKILLSAGWVVFGGEKGLTVYDAASGELARQIEGRYPLALFGDRLWVSTARRWDDSHYCYDLLGVSVLDLPSGETVQEFDIGRLTAVGRNVSDPALGLPVRTDAGILLLKPDGSLSNFQSRHPRFDADLTLTSQGLVCVEYFSMRETLMTEEELRETPISWRRDADGLNSRPHDLDAEIWLLDVDSGSKRWSRQVERGKLSFSLTSKCSEKHLALYCRLPSEEGYSYPGRLRVFHIADGSLVLDTEQVNTQTLHFTEYELGSDAVYLVAGYLPYSLQSRMCSIGYRDHTFHTFPQIELDSVSDCAFHDGRLYTCSTTRSPLADPISSDQTQALAIELAADGLPIPAEPVRLDFPQPDLSLVERFLATDDPLADKEFKFELVAAGAVPFNALIKRMAELTPTQLEALMDLGVYHGNHSPNYDMRPAAVIEGLAKVADPEYIPRIKRWLEDDRLAKYRDELTIALAACGDRATVEYLNKDYESFLHRRREPLKCPYHLPEVDSEIGWCEAYDSGVRYMAYVCDDFEGSLVSRRDIYLAVDVDGDGGYEEILHTGLKDFQRLYLANDSYSTGDSSHPLTLQVNGDEVRLTHFRELKLDPDIADTLYTRAALVAELVEAGPQTSTLSLTELRRDSDADGLTDIIEGQLLIDANNPDTDGDGIEDFYDPQPGVDPAGMGRLERGVSRALFFSYVNLVGGVAAYDPEAPGHPWDAYYMEIEGAGDVACSYRPNEFGVSLASPAAKQKFHQLAGIERGCSLEVNVVDLSKAQPDKVLEAGDFSSPEAWVQRPGIPGTCEYVITMDTPSSREVVHLVDLDGELYPIKWWGCGG